MPGTVTVAIPVDERWSLQVGDQSLAPRPAFGATTAYDVTSSGAASLGYTTSTSRALLLIVQLVVWLTLLLGISRFDTATLVQRRWRRNVVEPEAPLLSIDAPIEPLAPLREPGPESVPETGSASDDETVSWQIEPQPDARD